MMENERKKQVTRWQLQFCREKSSWVVPRSSRFIGDDSLFLLLKLLENLKGNYILRVTSGHDTISTGKEIEAVICYYCVSLSHRAIKARLVIRSCDCFWFLPFFYRMRQRPFMTFLFFYGLQQLLLANSCFRKILHLRKTHVVSSSSNSYSWNCLSSPLKNGSQNHITHINNVNDKWTLSLM